MSKRPPRPQTAVALLRGINVGGKNKLPMKALVALLEDAGCEGVRTYIQSGNVVFRAPAAVRDRLPETLAAALERQHGLKVPVVVRTAAALRRIARENPFLAEGLSTEHFHVAFLSRRPTKTQAAALDPERSPPDRFVLRGSELYLYCPRGMARTKLTNAYLDRTLDGVSTVRNWKTVVALLDLLA